MRVGQKNKLTYRWARTGSRPRAAHDQRTQSTYLFGAVCPEHGTGAALVLPFCNTEAMQLHLDEIATKVSAGAHAILILDQAGWHGAKELRIPEQSIALAIAAACTRAQFPREHLAVHAAELAVEPYLQILRRHRRSLLLRMEHADQSALENHVHRTPRLGGRRSLNLRIGINRRSRGDKIRIVGGVFCDSVGLYEGLSSSERVAILLELLGRKVRIFLGTETIEAA